MLLKSAKIIVVLSMLATVPAFAQKDTRDSRDTETKKERNERQGRDASQGRNDNDTEALKDGVRKTEKDNKDRRDKDFAAEEISAGVRKTGKTGVAEKIDQKSKDALAKVQGYCAGVCERIEFAQGDQKDWAALEQMNAANSGRFGRMMQKLIGKLSKYDAKQRAQIGKMARAMKNLFLAAQLKTLDISEDTLADSVEAYIPNFTASENWTAIENQAAKYVNQGKSLRDARFLAAKDVIKARHPEMPEAVRDRLAREIVDRKMCV